MGLGGGLRDDPRARPGAHGGRRDVPARVRGPHHEAYGPCATCSGPRRPAAVYSQSVRLVPTRVPGRQALDHRSQERTRLARSRRADRQADQPADVPASARPRPRPCPGSGDCPRRRLREDLVHRVGRRRVRRSTTAGTPRARWLPVVLGGLMFGLVGCSSCCAADSTRCKPPCPWPLGCLVPLSGYVVDGRRTERVNQSDPHGGHRRPAPARGG